MPKIYLTLLLVSALVIEVLAQRDYRPGFIVKQNGDSTSGWVSYRSEKKNNQVCFFRPGEKETTIEYKPDQLLSYGFLGDKRYEVINVGTPDSAKNVFAQCVVKGRLSLYRHDNAFYLETSGSLIKLPPKKDSTIYTDKGSVVREDRRYVGILNSLISECNISATKKTQYAESHFAALVQQYNRCKGQAGLIYKEEKPSTRVNFHLLAGLDVTKFKLDDGYLPFAGSLPTFEDDVSTTPTFGLGLDLSAPRLFDKLFFTVEAWYQKQTYHGYSDQQLGADYFVYEDHYLNASFLKVPLGIRYSFSQESNTPYFQVGFVQYFIQSADLTVEVESVINSNSETTITDYDFMDRNPSGVWAGVGYSRTIGNKLKAIAEVRIESTNGFVGPTLDPYSNTTSLNFLVGIKF